MTLIWITSLLTTIGISFIFLRRFNRFFAFSVTAVGIILLISSIAWYQFNPLSITQVQRSSGVYQLISGTTSRNQIYWSNGDGKLHKIKPRLGHFLISVPAKRQAQAIKISTNAQMTHQHHVVLTAVKGYGYYTAFASDFNQAQTLIKSNIGAGVHNVSLLSKTPIQVNVDQHGFIVGLVINLTHENNSHANQILTGLATALTLKPAAMIATAHQATTHPDQVYLLKNDIQSQASFIQISKPKAMLVIEIQSN